jgi:hypothetical protein
MPPLIAAVLVGAGLYLGYRAAARLIAERRDRDASPEDSEAGVEGPQKDLGALERDPATGVYRPSKPRE